MSSAARILAEQLQHYGHGDALWNPSPQDDEELSIGDVGCIDNYGSFVRFFNATEDAKSSSNKHGVPVGFDPINIPDLHRRSREHYPPPGALTSLSIRNTSINVQAKT